MNSAAHFITYLFYGVCVVALSIAAVVMGVIVIAYTTNGGRDMWGPLKLIGGIGLLTLIGWAAS